ACLVLRTWSVPRAAYLERASCWCLEGASCGVPGGCVAPGFSNWLRYASTWHEAPPAYEAPAPNKHRAPTRHPAPTRHEAPGTNLSCSYDSAGNTSELRGR